MNPTPPSAAGSSTSRSPEPQFRVVRKRNRVPLSCYPCRTRKKCDRSHPCSNCIKREGSDTHSCSYASPVSRRKNQSQGELSPDDMQNRIDRLEGLVLSLMHGAANANIDVSPAAPLPSSSSGATSNPSPSTYGSGSYSVPPKLGTPDDGAMQDEDESDIDEGLANSLGVLKMDTARSKHVYLGEEHWHTILLDIAEVKNYFANHKKDLEKSFEKIRLAKPPTANQPPALLMGATPATEVEIRAELPPKSTILALCARYFDSMDHSANFIHRPTFHKQLRDHWQDPSKTPIMWLAVLYAILCLAMLSYSKAGDEPPEWKGRTLELADEYRLRIVQCLIAGEYTKPGQYTVEALVLYTACEHSSRWDSDHGIWMIIAMTVRTALRMGYHRDGKWFPDLTPFEAEMRRRAWAFIRTSDIFFSHQVSLPSMIAEHDCDTELPHNLYDEEFGPDTKVLPPSRPNTEPTPISYMIAKVKLCLQLGAILQATGRLKNQVHYDEILQLDAKLREIKSEMPPHLQLETLECSNDPPGLMMARFNLDTLYLKIMCLLHRKYVPRARHNPRYAHSRRSAIEASLGMLRHLATLNRETQPNGRLHPIRWYFKQMATKDFTLPAMLIALDLHYNDAVHGAKERRNSQELPFWTQEQREEMFNRLEMTRDIWRELADISMDAVKASHALDIMLTKIKNSASGDESAAMGTGSTVSQPGHSAIVTPGLLSSGTRTNPTVGSNGMQPSVGSAYRPLNLGFDTANAPLGVSTVSSTSTGIGSMAGPGFSSPVLGLDAAQSPFTLFDNMTSANMDFSTNFDWDSFDNYTQTAHWGAASLPFFPTSSEQSQQQGEPDQPGQAGRQGRQDTNTSTPFPYGLDLAGPS